MLRKTEGKRKRGWKRTRWLDSITDSMDVNLSKLWKTAKDRLQSVRRKDSDTGLSDSTTITITTMGASGQLCKSAGFPMTQFPAPSWVPTAMLSSQRAVPPHQG